ncbi:MAG: hypothetical protein QM698_06370 [Micropepsaceae bacterium]
MRLIALAVASVLSVGAARAASETIQCPENVRVEATSGVPAGWVATPQIESASSVEVIRMADREVLACVYRFYGGDYKIYREKPEIYPNCSQFEMGFRCTR